MPRTITIGDVHGCADEFEELLITLKLNPDDRVIQVGDLVNRGPDSHRVVKLACEYKVESVLGNHELRLLTARKKNDKSLLKDYDTPTFDRLTKNDWKYMSQMPKYIHLEELDTVIVHGGFLPNEPWETQSVETITSIQVVDAKGRPAKRSDAPDKPAWAVDWKKGPFVVYGHTPRPNIFDLPRSIGIDTGCVYGGHLTAYIIEDKSIVQVRAKEAYARSRRLPEPV